MPQSYYVSGKPVMVPYTPGAAVAAGDVIVTSDTPRVAHLDIPANTLGHVAVFGGVYQFPKATTGGSAIGDNKLVYWDNTNKVVTTTASTNKRIGYTVGASADADALQAVFHQPA